MGRLHDVYRATRGIGGSLDMAFAQAYMLEMDGRPQNVSLPQQRKFMSLRLLGISDFCWCNAENNHDAVVIYDDWGSGPQCVMCGRHKEACS